MSLLYPQKSGALFGVHGVYGEQHFAQRKAQAPSKVAGAKRPALWTVAWSLLLGDFFHSASRKRI
jgi:hypothetical protein